MSRNGLFERVISVNDMIAPIMVSGVLEWDYEGERTREGFNAGLESAMSMANDQLVSGDPAFRELDDFVINGADAKWRANLNPAPQYADGHYYIMEKVALAPIYTVLESDCDQTITIRFNAKRLRVWLNGEIVLDNADINDRKHERVYVFEHVTKPNYETASVKLLAGENRLLAVQGCVGRGTGMSFSMELLECRQPVRAKIPLSMDSGVRESIAASQLETYMVDDCWKSGETPIVHIGHTTDLGKICGITLGLIQADAKKLGGAVGEDISVTTEDTALPSDLKAGPHGVKVQWRLPDGTLLNWQEMRFTVVDTVQPLPGFDNFEPRRRWALERLASSGDPLALYKLERYDEISMDLIRSMCDRIERRADCADFFLLPLLWMVWEDLRDRHLTDELTEAIRHAAVGFRYWVDEPGVSSMFYCSENHRIGFHVCEYLAGLLYPLDMFTNCGQNGMYHSLKGRMHLVEWLNQRCRAGFDEPHSDSYLPVTLSALLVLREVLPMEEYPLRNMVNILLDFMTYIFAVSAFDGVMATPRGRSYNAPLRSGLMSGHASGLFWMLFGNAEANAGGMHSEFAFSPYIPPKGLLDLADNFIPATFFFKEGIMHFDKHNADFTIRRTRDYIIGGVRDHNVGMCDMHFISAMIALRGDVTVFFSAPQNMAEGSGLRPDYWAGQAFLPRVLTAGRTLVVIWHNVANPNIWMTHCHFNARKFDEVISREGWTFGRKGDGYVAIHSSAPHELSKEGLYAWRELQCPGNEAVWLAECGRQAEDGSFGAFIERVVNASLWQDERGYHYDSPGSGLMEFGLESGFTVNRKDEPIPEYLALSPWLKSRFGSGRFEYAVPEFTTTQWSYPLSE
ncbi:MAG: DUF1080 domain-containing protein [Oscillospiraceae bacterium]|jgi:hypothetical protein|nr:DUF1080 domain-containing protein [Oscillospiraceae bacterium]